MAIRKRVNKDGSITQHVTWREGGKHRSLKVPEGTPARLFEAQILAGVQGAPGSVTVAEALESYLRIVRSRVQPTSYAKYQDYAQRWILPTLGAQRVDSLRPDHLQAWASGLCEKLSVSVVQQFCVGLLRSAINLALQHGLVRSNPLSGRVYYPKQVPKGEPRALDASEARRLLDCCATWYQPICLVALHTGMRIGEILAMRWEHLDLEARTYTVRETRTQSGSLQAPKTQASAAAVPLSRAVCEVLAGMEREGAFLFSYTQKQTGSALKQACKLAGIGHVRQHDLRHTCASLMAAAGVPVAVVSKQLRHATVSMTWDKYQHLYPQQRHEGADAIGELI